MRHFIKVGFASLLAVITLNLSTNVSAANSDELYQQLGKQEGISRLVEELLFEIAGDNRIADQFVDTDIDRLHRTLTEQICEISGGPCSYSGDDMVKVHTGLEITQADMNALVENLYTAMERLDIPVSAQNQLLALLAEMHDEVVGL